MPTLAGDQRTLNVTVAADGAIFINNAARVLVADILLANGVLHVIDAVLDPNDTAADPASAPVSRTAPAVLFPSASSVATVPFTAQLAGSQTVSVNPALTSTTDRVAAGYSTAPVRNTDLTTGTGTGTGTSKAAAAPRRTAAAVEMAALLGGCGIAAVVGMGGM